MTDSDSASNKKFNAGWVPTIILLVMLVVVVCFVVLSKQALFKRTSIHWDMPVAYSETNFQTINAKKFVSEVFQCTNGGLDISVHSGGSLYKGGEIKRATQEGLVSIGERLLSTHFNENPLFGFDSLPFIASEFEVSDRLWQAAKKVLSDDMGEENLTLLYSVPWPPSGLYFKHAIDDIEQLKNSKFRSYSVATARFAELSGMIPVQIEAAELNQALALGVVDSFMASGSTGYDRKVWEHMTHFYDVKAWLPRNYVFANKQDFQRLPNDYRQCLLTASTEAELRGTQTSKELADWYINELKKNGMNIVQANESLDLALSEIGSRMVEEWKAIAGDKGEEIIISFQQQQ